jgi:hypothetical protein
MADHKAGFPGLMSLKRYMMNKQSQSLPDYLNNRVFQGSEYNTVKPDTEGVQGYKAFMERYGAGLDVEHKAIKMFRA